jgi:integrase
VIAKKSTVSVGSRKQSLIICPECKSTKTWKDGFRHVQNRSVQRYYCRDCGFRFSDPNFCRKRSNSASYKQASRQICVLEDEMINLVAAKTTEKNAAGEKNTNGKIVEYLWFLKKQGYAESTITRNVRLLKALSKRGGNLLEPESVKLVIAEQKNWKPTTKEHAVTAYAGFLKMLGKKWSKPRYNRVRKLPFIPHENEVNDLISGCNRKTCAFVKLLKETGMRSGEAWQLKWTDFNFENRTVSITPEKGSNPRMLPLSTDLVAMLKGLQENSNKVFEGSLRHFRRSFRRQRKRIAEKLKNPRINEITFHTLRHFKATMEYHKTKDILHVKQLLGHKSINSTLLYTQLISFKENDYYVKVAHSVDEACELVKTGFQYVTGDYSDGGKIFRKPK